MIFHVTSQHTWETCEGALAFKGEDVPPRSERQRWVEGNDKVKVIGAYGYQTQHRFYAILEANDYADVQALLSDLMGADIAAKTQNAIPNCELVQLDSGHLPHLERPDELIRVMNAFLKD